MGGEGREGEDYIKSDSNKNILALSDCIDSIQKLAVDNKCL